MDDVPTTCSPSIKNASQRREELNFGSRRSDLVAASFSQYGENQKKPTPTANSNSTIAVKNEEPEPSINNKLDGNSFETSVASILVPSAKSGQTADPGSSCTESMVHGREPSPQREMNNMFGRREQPKKTSKCKTSNWDDSDEDEIQTKKKKTSKRKPFFLDDEDDELHPCKKSTVGMDDSDEEEIQGKITPSKPIFVDDEDDKPQPGKQSTADMDFDLPSKQSCAIQKNVMEKVDEKVECFAEALDQPFTDAELSSAQVISCLGNRQANAPCSTVSDSGWLNVCTRKSESANNNDRDLKPDPEVCKRYFL